MFMGRTRMIIEAQERHIRRLEKMVEALFGSLMVATKSPYPPSLDLTREEPEISGSQETEPAPGELFDPSKFPGRP